MNQVHDRQRRWSERPNRGYWVRRALGFIWRRTKSLVNGFASLEQVVFGRKPKVTLFSYNWHSVRHMARIFKDFAVSIENGRLVDLGAGASPYRCLFDRYVKQYIAVDFSESLPPTCDASSVSLVAGDITRLPLSDASIDTICCFQVVSHVRNPRRLIYEINRVLRPGGQVIISTSYAAPIQVEPYDVCRFTPDGLSSLFREENLQVTQRLIYGGLFSSFALCLNLSMILSPIRPNEPMRFSRKRQWLLAPVIGLINLGGAVLDFLLPLNRMPAGFALTAVKPSDNASLPLPTTSDRYLEAA